VPLRGVLAARLAAIAALAIAFLAFTFAVSAGWASMLDQQVLRAMESAWREPLHPLFQAIAELGGAELTSLLMLALGFYLLREGFGADAWVLVAFVAAVLLETLYKVSLHHLGPPRAVAHTDGPSITDVLSRSGILGNSYPSGHVVRAVVTYGLIAFVVRRLSTSPVARALAFPVAAVVVLMVAFDRLYLDVHWESDVLGGLLLGAIALLGAIVWLDRPRGTS
jgi:membrane-associated phospholipid phosphatase